MTGTSRYGRAAGATLAAIGILLLAGVAQVLVELLPLLLGSEGEHMAGDAMLWVIIIGLPVTIAALLCLVPAYWLWRGRRGGRALLALWLAGAALVCAVCWTAEMNILSIVRRVLFESSSPWVTGSSVCAGSPDGGFYCGQLDDPAFWLPGVLAVAGLVLLGILVLWVASDRRGESSAR
jgi:hypothetical protein